MKLGNVLDSNGKNHQIFQDFLLINRNYKYDIESEDKLMCDFEDNISNIPPFDGDP